ARQDRLNFRSAKARRRLCAPLRSCGKHAASRPSDIDLIETQSTKSPRGPRTARAGSINQGVRATLLQVATPGRARARANSGWFVGHVQSGISVGERGGEEVWLSGNSLETGL